MLFHTVCHCAALCFYVTVETNVYVGKFENVVSLFLNLYLRITLNYVFYGGL